MPAPIKIHRLDGARGSAVGGGASYLGELVPDLSVWDKTLTFSAADIYAFNYSMKYSAWRTPNMDRLKPSFVFSTLYSNAIYDFARLKPF